MCVKSYKYVGVTITAHGCSETKIKTSTRHGKRIIRHLQLVLWNTQSRQNTKIRINKTIVESIMTNRELRSETDRTLKNLVVRDKYEVLEIILFNAS